jgi:hypothetical protein
MIARDLDLPLAARLLLPVPHVYYRPQAEPVVFPHIPTTFLWFPLDRKKASSTVDHGESPTCLLLQYLLVPLDHELPEFKALLLLVALSPPSETARHKQSCAHAG